MRETIIDGLAGTVHGDESTWCLVEKGAELQILLRGHRQPLGEPPENEE